MSDILIKGMDMPKDCWSCPMIKVDLITGQRYCGKTFTDIKDSFIRLSNCPLKKIPTPHGRLIDADKLLSVIERNSYRLKNFYNSCDEGMFLSGIKQAISEAPTIIESEE